jgi:crotonobetainyl-CoA:carnitine CoA-transferase CaiB-like acyl-CoA transferase
MTGYVAAAGMMAALLRRSIEGGSYHVKLSLAQSAMWVQELNRRGHLSCECARRILFRQADLTEERLEPWNGAERVGHGIHV